MTKLRPAEVKRVCDAHAAACANRPRARHDVRGSRRPLRPPPSAAGVPRGKVGLWGGPGPASVSPREQLFCLLQKPVHCWPMRRLLGPAVSRVGLRVEARRGAKTCSWLGSPLQSSGLGRAEGGKQGPLGHCVFWTVKLCSVLSGFQKIGWQGKLFLLVRHYDF